MDVSGMASAVRAMSSKQVVFRADASLDIGTGHVMRCLTLANALRENGWECHFLCREQPGNLIEFIRAQEHHAYPLAHSLTTANSRSESEGVALAHAAWLDASQLEDAAACQVTLEKIKPKWLVVDHYALDSRWEQAVMPHFERLMVIDDLADRLHQCDLLLDQTFGRQAEDYAPWVLDDCKVLCGAQYALLRPEFAELRPYSLQRRHSPKLKRILVTMGGIDKDNATGQILDVLDRTILPAGCQITVVMGATAPWIDTVRQRSAAMSHPTTVLAAVSHMAHLMADSDLAIGAAGATSWERCCLGLPTILIILAENQRGIGRALAHSGSAYLVAIDEVAKGIAQNLKILTYNENELREQSHNASLICDGQGTRRLVSEMNRFNN